ncbi:MAG: serine--tRNA ligase [Candidatus Babeliales bacterium]
MIDLNLLREEPEKTVARILKKDPSFNAQRLHELDQDVRGLRLQVEELRHKKNELAQAGKKGVTDELRQQSIEVSKKLKEAESDLEKVEKEFQELYLSCPNIPAEDIPEGFKESNKVVKEYGKKPTFNFSIKNHVELGTALGWFDFEAATKITGSNFVVYLDDAVKLMYALTMFMLDNNKKHGFKMVLPPYLVNEKSLYVPGNFPKFKDQVYAIPEDGFYLIPTAEVALANLYRDHIFATQDLPKRLTAWTGCFRREAGGYGATERGLIRIHEFEKVELFTFCQPEEADKELERMLVCAEELLQQLGLTYRVSLLAAQDCSFPATRTLDIEVWMPGQNAYYEVSSASNCSDFQARRGAIRYRRSSTSKPELVYTLNASSLALPRLMVALMETYQQEDGSIKIPEILKKYGVW